MFEFLSENISRAFSKLSGARILKKQLVSDVLEKVKHALLESDVPLDVATDFCAQVTQECVGKKLKSGLTAEQQLVKAAHVRLQSFLGGKTSTDVQKQLAGTVLCVGLQGAGKTTSIAKLAYYVQQSAGRKKILVGSTDYSRPAAIEQLEQLCQRVEVDFYRPDADNAVQAARQLAQKRVAGGYDLLLLDTAGRLQVDTALMDELQEVKKTVAARCTVLVLDGMTGQQSLAVARSFQDSVGFDWAIMSKMDSKSSGGAAFSFFYRLQKPVVFVGTGEQIRDLESFNPERVAGQILGMGDVLTLAEKAEKEFTQKERSSAENMLEKGRFTFDDFASQADVMQRMGSFQSVMKYLPKSLTGGLSAEMIDQGARQVSSYRAIISSMTPKERLCRVMLNGSRVSRIAAGAGVSVATVQAMMKRFEEMQRSVKMLSKMSKNNRFFR